MTLREISPAVNATVDEFLNMASPELRAIAENIREQKRNGTRTVPSRNFIDCSEIKDREFRNDLIDKIAVLVDENLFGRSEMCQQFAMLLSRTLNHLGIYAKVVRGKAIYSNGFSWEHYWVATKDEIIDANVDSIFENPAVPSELKLCAYWGKKADLPSDRKLRPKTNKKIPPDNDVKNIWWPELKQWLSQYSK